MGFSICVGIKVCFMSVVRSSIFLLKKATTVWPKRLVQFLSVVSLKRVEFV